jgi:hypothetical protein
LASPAQGAIVTALEIAEETAGEVMVPSASA